MIDPAISASAAYFGITADDILGPGRNSRFVKARNAAAYIMRHRDGASYPEIGRRLGRDHTSVMHGVRKCTDAVQADRSLAAFVAAQIARRVYEGPRPAPPPPPPPPPRKWERIVISGAKDSPLVLDEDGYQPCEIIARDGIIHGSRRLAQAINAARLAA